MNEIKIMKPSFGISSKEHYTPHGLPACIDFVYITKALSQVKRFYSATVSDKKQTQCYAMSEPSHSFSALSSNNAVSNMSTAFVT